MTVFHLVAAALVLAFTDLSYLFDLARMPIDYLKWIGLLVLVYIIFIEVFKRIYVKIKGGWL